MAARAAAHVEELAGRMLKPCQLSQRAMASTPQKAMASLGSARSVTDRAAQGELQGEFADTQVSAAGRA